MTLLRRDRLGALAHDLAVDDIVMTSSADGVGFLADNACSIRASGRRGRVVGGCWSLHSDIRPRRRC